MVVDCRDEACVARDVSGIHNVCDTGVIGSRGFFPTLRVIEGVLVVFPLLSSGRNLSFHQRIPGERAFGELKDSLSDEAGALFGVPALIGVIGDGSLEGRGYRDRQFPVYASRGFDIKPLLKPIPERGRVEDLVIRVLLGSWISLCPWINEVWGVRERGIRGG